MASIYDQLTFDTLRNNQNTNLLPNNQNTNNQGLAWWMNADRGRWPSPMMPPMLDPSKQMGASNYRGPQGLPFHPSQGNIPYAPEEKTALDFSKFIRPITGVLQGIKDKFKYRGAQGEAWDPTTGQMLSAEEQDEQNALGGYYSDAARHDRVQRARLTKMLARKKAGKENFSQTNIDRLIDQGYGPKITPPVITAQGDQVNTGGHQRGWDSPGYTTQGGFTGTRSTSGPRGTTASGRGHHSWAQGGRIGLRIGGAPEDYPENEPENIFQIMQEENIPFSEQVEGDPFDLRIQELMDKGLSYDDAYEIAEQEFQHLFSEGSEQDQGIASLV